MAIGNRIIGWRHSVAALLLAASSFGAHAALVQGSATLQVSSVLFGVPTFSGDPNAFSASFSYDTALLAGIGTETTPLISYAFHMPHDQSSSIDPATPWTGSGFVGGPLEAVLHDGNFYSLQGHLTAPFSPAIVGWYDFILGVANPADPTPRIEGQTCFNYAATCQFGSGYSFESLVVTTVVPVPAPIVLMLSGLAFMVALVRVSGGSRG